MSLENEQMASARLHGGWMDHKSTEKHKWSPVWCVLKRDGTLFFFVSEDTSLENHIGTLRLSKESSFHYGPGDQKDGYKFDLHIQKKKKKFRVKKQYDRELWRTYMVGVITGVVPQDGTLSPQDIQTILEKFQLTSPSSPSSPNDRISSGQTAAPSSSDRQPQPHPNVHFSLGESDLDESASSLQLGSGQRRPSVPSLSSVSTGSSGGSGGGLDPPVTHSLSDFSTHGSSHTSSSFDSGVADSAGGPFMHHKFDSTGSTIAPSWFFEDCNRELAEKILTECRHMGNTLMRVSSSARPTGSYVITKRLESSEKIVHYEVIRVSEGYKINAENIKKTMKTLKEVMDFFIQLSGPSTTRPMKCNDLRQLGVEYDAYNRGPILPQQDSPTVTAADFEPPEDNYEVPQQQSQPFAPVVPQQGAPTPPPPAPPAPPSSGLPRGHLTWGKQIGDPKWQGLPEAGPASKTVGPAERRQIKPESVKPSVMHVNRAMEEHHVVSHLDAVISGEEQRIHRGAQQQQQQQDKPPPLPAVPADRPKLCKPASSGYVNDNWPDPDRVDGDVHPRWNKRSQSVPVISQDVLGVQVPASVAPPSLVKPGGVGVGEGGGGKVPPPTAPKSTRFPLKRFSVDQTDREKAMHSELEQKLKLRALKTEQQTEPQPTPPSASSQGTAPPLPSHPPPLTSPPKPDNCPPSPEDLYEDINQYYQNLPQHD